jgi:type VI protein secretion system component VasF
LFFAVFLCSFLFWSRIDRAANIRQSSHQQPRRSQPDVRQKRNNIAEAQNQGSTLQEFSAELRILKALFVILDRWCQDENNTALQLQLSFGSICCRIVQYLI